MRKEEGKNEETKPIFEVAYLGNAGSDFAQIWNVECWSFLFFCWSWRACPQQKSSCFIKAAQSYGGAKIAPVFALPVNILMGVARRLLGPHNTLPYVLISNLQLWSSAVAILAHWCCTALYSWGSHIPSTMNQAFLQWVIRYIIKQLCTWFLV